MLEIVKTFIAGMILGGVFTLLKLPLPAPPVFAGIMWIVWVYVWFILINKIIWNG